MFISLYNPAKNLYQVCLTKGAAMHIGVPKEIKNNENRVALVPEGVHRLVAEGHRVFVETAAGEGVGISDRQYVKAGAEILPSLEEIFKAAEMIIKVKEPQPREIALLEARHILYTYLHLAADGRLAKSLMESGATCVAYETIQDEDGSLPLLTPMSEVAGRMAAQVGAHYLQSDSGGKGVLLGGVTGTGRAKVTVIGCGIAGTNAIKMAVGLGAQVRAVDVSPKRLAELDDIFGGKITTLFSNAGNVERAIVDSDLVIGAALVPGAKAPRVVSRELVSRMEKGSVIVDIAVDQGGCVETCRPTSHEEPIYFVDGIIHYCVSNIPGAVAKTSTYALTNVTLHYASLIAGHGIEGACRNKALKKGVNIYGGGLVYKQIAEDLALPYTPLRLD